jgi:tRNA(fMet)-specific endonuclease VapC
VPVLDVDVRAARVAGAVRAELAARGTPIGPYDVLIAGQARAEDLILATGNVREFRRVKGLKVETWR